MFLFNNPLPTDAADVSEEDLDDLVHDFKWDNEEGLDADEVIVTNDSLTRRLIAVDAEAEDDPKCMVSKLFNRKHILLMTEKWVQGESCMSWKESWMLIDYKIGWCCFYSLQAFHDLLL